MFLPEASSSSLLTAKALARLRLCAGLSEPLLVACVISTIFSCAGSFLIAVKEDPYLTPGYLTSVSRTEADGEMISTLSEKEENKTRKENKYISSM